jgi:hypothetical protein
MIEKLLKDMIEDAVKAAQKEIVETAAAAVKSQMSHLIRESEENVLSTVEDEYLQVRDYDSYDTESAVEFILHPGRRTALEGACDFMDELGMCASEIQHAVTEFNAMHDELSELITAPPAAPAQEALEGRLKALEDKSESDLWGNILDIEKRLSDIENFLLRMFKGFEK